MISKLEYFNDPNFKFDPISHSYTYMNAETGKPIQIFEPVSKFISQFKTPFDADRIARYVAKSKKTTKAAILAEWAATAKEGTDLGTFVHEWIEDYYNGKNPPLPVPIFEDLGLGALNSDETFEHKALDRIQKFQSLYEDKLYKFKPICQEFRIFSRKWGIAGTLDGLFELTKSHYVGDWKTNKDFTDDDHPKGRRQKLLYPFEDLWDNNLNGYSLQLSTYRLILEEEAGFETEGGFLAWIGTKDPKMYKTLDLRDRLRDYLKNHSLGF